MAHVRNAFPRDRCIGRTRASILVGDVQEAARRWFSLRLSPGALTVIGAPSLKAVSQLLVLVNANG